MPCPITVASAGMRHPMQRFNSPASPACNTAAAMRYLPDLPTGVSRSSRSLRHRHAGRSAASNLFRL